MGAATVGNRIVAVGGRDDHGAVQDVVWWLAGS
jgi:hypothetical protein